MTNVFGTGLLDKSSKNTVTLVDFFWGSIGNPTKNHRRFVDTEGPSKFLGAEWISTPDMEISLPKMTGSLQEEKAVINLPLIENFFTDYISDGMPFAPTRMHVMEIVSARDELILDPLTERPQVIHLFKGDVSMAIRHPRGKRNRVSIEAKSAKTQLKNTTMGILATNTCAHPHGGTGCYQELGGSNAAFGNVSLLDTVYIESIVDGALVTLNSPNSAHFQQIINKPASNNGETVGYWDEGYFQIEGLRLKIRKWGGLGSNQFWLMNQPRVSLLGTGNLGDLVRGCDKSLTACRYFDNEEFFGGYGFGIPDYNPLFEVK